jgi:hypothetical protein
MTSGCRHLKHWLLGCIICAAIFICASSAQAQYLSSACSSLEKVIGPIVPPRGLGATFRSELSTAVSIAYLGQARLIGTASATQPYYGALDLSDIPALERTTMKFDIQAKLRLWRVGLVGAYTFFDDKTRKSNLGSLGFTGARLGVELDVIQANWLTVGASVDSYLNEPYWRGPIPADPPNPVINFMSLVDLDVSGQKPWQFGAYVRYVPPEIFNFPLHVEAFYKHPWKGASLQEYGVSLVFRPQIYRFDTAIKINAEKYLLNFKNERSTENVREWKINTDWLIYGAEWVIYF